MSDEPHYQFPKTVALVRELGLDPDAMSVLGMTTAGYLTLKRDENGNRIINKELNEYETEVVPWPTLAIGIQVVDSLIREGWKP